VSYARGDVVLVKFPDSNLITFKRRPALVIQDPLIPTGLSQVILALITSNLLRTGQTRVRVDAATARGKAMGLLNDSVIVTDNVTTVSTQAVIKTIGKCPIMGLVGAALRKTLGL
jgi:mRNA interferase MazF